jgi:hypothetical protein
MTEHRFKTTLGLLLIALNLSIFLFVFGCFLMGGFDATQFTTVLAIVFPMFACYATAAIRYFTTARFVRAHVSNQLIASAFTVLSFGMPTLFALIIMLVIGAQADGVIFTNFTQFTTILLMMESVFSINIGMLVYTIFVPIDTQHLRSGL